MKSEEGKKIIIEVVFLLVKLNHEKFQLIKNADVLVENFLPQTMEKLGLGYKDVKEMNPRLIYCSISGANFLFISGYF